jgi:hypothetical protein
MRFARGHWALPLSAEELWSKFRDCTSTTLQENGAHALFDGLQALERQGNMRELGAR